MANAKDIHTNAEFKKGHRQVERSCEAHSEKDTNRLSDRFL